MKITDLLRGRSDSAPEAVPTGTLPIAGYDGLDAKQVIAHFRELSQVELAEIEDYERSHRKPRGRCSTSCATCAAPSPSRATTRSSRARSCSLLEDADMAPGPRDPRLRGQVPRPPRGDERGGAGPARRQRPTLDEQHRRDEKALRTRTGIQERSDRNA